MGCIYFSTLSEDFLPCVFSNGNCKAITKAIDPQKVVPIYQFLQSAYTDQCGNFDDLIVSAMNKAKAIIEKDTQMIGKNPQLGQKIGWTQSTEKDPQAQNNKQMKFLMSTIDWSSQSEWNFQFLFSVGEDVLMDLVSKMSVKQMMCRWKPVVEEAWNSISSLNQLFCSQESPHAFKIRTALTWRNFHLDFFLCAQNRCAGENWMWFLVKGSRIRLCQISATWRNSRRVTQWSTVQI